VRIRSTSGPVRALLLAGAVSLTACGISTTRIVESGPVATDPAQLAARADSLFGLRPREAGAAERALSLMGTAARGVPEGAPDRYHYAARSARFAAWLANHLEDGRSEAFADSALVFANTAVAEDPEGVEGYYWRAVASGLYARGSRLTRGRSAMTRIREDAGEAARGCPDQVRA